MSFIDWLIVQDPSELRVRLVYVLYYVVLHYFNDDVLYYVVLH